MVSTPCPERVDEVPLVGLRKLLTSSNVISRKGGGMKLAQRQQNELSVAEELGGGEGGRPILTGKPQASSDTTS